VRTLIAIISCHRDRPWQQAQRDTWIKDIPTGTDYAFFLGRPYFATAQDEVFLDVPDDSNGLPHKTRAMANWALARGYDFVFKCDIDNFVVPELMLNSDFAQHDFTGGRNQFFASGGSGYWLNRGSMRAVGSGNPEGYGPAEDVFVAKTLEANGIGLHADPRYKYCPGDVFDASTITYHLSSIRGWAAKYAPEMMYQTYADKQARIYRTYR
jgi:hypothetical protein